MHHIQGRLNSPLDQLLLNGRELVRHPLRRFSHCRCRWLCRCALYPFLYLLPDVVHLINGIMGLGELVPNLHEQGKLRFQIGLANADAWIRANFAGGGQPLVSQAEFDLIRARQRQRSSQTALGGDIARDGVHPGSACSTRSG